MDKLNLQIESIMTGQRELYTDRGNVEGTEEVYAVAFHPIILSKKELDSLLKIADKHTISTTIDTLEAE